MDTSHMEHPDLSMLNAEYVNEQYVKLFCNPVTRGLGYHNEGHTEATHSVVH